jgi:hypothetical protein
MEVGYEIRYSSMERKPIDGVGALFLLGVVGVGGWKGLGAKHQHAGKLSRPEFSFCG